MIDKSKVKKILTNLEQKVDRPLNADGNLDVAAFNKLKETRQAICKLEKLGVNKQWLANHFFLTASLILDINCYE